MIVPFVVSPAPLAQSSALPADAPLRYPDNANFHHLLVRRAQIEDRLGLGKPHAPLRLVSITLERWSAAHERGFETYTVGPNRLVYRVVTAFDAPLDVHGNRWSSGRRTFIVDAETGDALYSVTQGNLIKSGGPPLRLSTPAHRTGRE